MNENVEFYISIIVGQYIHIQIFHVWKKYLHENFKLYIISTHNSTDTINYYTHFSVFVIIIIKYFNWLNINNYVTFQIKIIYTKIIPEYNTFSNCNVKCQ